MNKFAQYHLDWGERGFIEMMRDLLVREGAWKVAGVSRWRTTSPMCCI